MHQDNPSPSCSTTAVPYLFSMGKTTSSYHPQFHIYALGKNSLKTTRSFLYLKKKKNSCILTSKPNFIWLYFLGKLTVPICLQRLKVGLGMALGGL